MKRGQYASLHDRSRTGRALTVSGYALLALILAVTFFVFYYTDFSDTLDNAMMLGDSIVDGRFAGFYGYAANNADASTIFTANYNVFLYVVFLLWNLPTFILHRLRGYDYMNSLYALLWCKALMGAAVIATADLLRRIASLWTDDKRVPRLSALLFAASSAVVFPALVVAQYDILAVFAMLLGLYFYLKEKKLAFHIAFAVAVPLKLFALFIYIPLLLLREKRIWAFILKLLPAFAVNFIASLPFRGDMWYEVCLGSQSRDAVKLILDSSVSIGDLKLCPFIFAYAAICAACWLYPRERWDDGVRRYFVPVWICALTISSFVLLVAIRSYWVILLTPFVSLISTFDRERLRVNVLLTALGSSACTLYFCCAHWVLSYEHLTDRLILSRVSLPAGRELLYGSIRKLLSAHSVTVYAPVMFAVFAVSTVILLALNAPRRAAVGRWNKSDYDFGAWYFVLQTSLTAALVAVMLYAALATQPAALIRTYPSGEYGNDILRGTVVEQDFTAGETREVGSVELTVSNTATNRASRSTVTVTLTDGDTGRVLARGTAGTALIKTAEAYRIDIGRALLVRGHRYTVTLTGTARQNESGSVCPALSDDPTLPNARADGSDTGAPIAVVIR